MGCKARVFLRSNTRFFLSVTYSRLHVRLLVREVHDVRHRVCCVVLQRHRHHERGKHVWYVILHMIQLSVSINAAMMLAILL